MIICKVCGFKYDLNKNSRCPRCNTPISESLKCDMNCKKCKSNCTIDKNINKSIQ